ncbi:MAG: ribose 5-phosphate isomerase A [Candidatus Bathyarchaeia archaeon]
MSLSWIEDAKHRAVLKALEPIKTGWIIGLGSGSTMSYAVKELTRLRRARHIEVVVVPTSYQIESLAIAHGLVIKSINEVGTIDYAIDGADQVQEGSLNVIKGGGGAMLREKIIDSAAQTLAIVVHAPKLSKYLGGNQTVPVEVLPFAHKYVQSRIVKLGGRAKLRESASKVGPVITDNGNFLLDADFGRIQNPTLLERHLKAIPGLLETGLFLNMVDKVYVGLNNGVKLLTAK